MMFRIPVPAFRCSDHQPREIQRPLVLTVAAISTLAAGLLFGWVLIGSEIIFPDVPFYSPFPNHGLAADFGQRAVHIRSTWDGTTYRLEGYRFDSTGNPVGATFSIHEHVWQEYDQVSLGSRDAGALPDGTFVVVWRKFHDYTDEPCDMSTGSDRLYVSGFNQGGSETFSTQLHSESLACETDYLRNAGLATNAAGDFAVTWVITGNEYYFIPDEVWAQRFDDAGTALNPKTLININNASQAISMVPDIALADDGNSVAVWGNTADPSGLQQIRARFIDSTGTPTGGGIAGFGSHIRLEQPSSCGVQFGGVSRRLGEPRFPWYRHDQQEHPGPVG